MLDLIVVSKGPELESPCSEDSTIRQIQPILEGRGQELECLAKFTQYELLFLGESLPLLAHPIVKYGARIHAKGKRP
jgi:hypothetical protein